jgi:hypothetical protein
MSINFEPELSEPFTHHPAGRLHRRRGLMDVQPPAAFVFVPPGIPSDGHYAREGVTHIERRGYRFAGVLRDPDHVEQFLDQGTAEIVVFARTVHRTAEWAGTGLRQEVVGEETRRLTPLPPQAHPLNRRGFEPGSLDNEVSAYRRGYADGYVDAVTMRSAMRRQRGPD